MLYIDPIWGHIISIILAAFIGYITNLLAIKMLFRPYKVHRIGKMRIPFTPGIIPKNRYRISIGIADMIANDIIKEEALAQNLINNLSFNGTIADYVKEHNLSETLDNAKDHLSEKIANNILNKFNNEDIASHIVEELLAGIRPKLGFFGGMVDGFKEPITEKIREYVNQNGKDYIQNYVNEEYHNLLSKDFNELKEKALVQALQPFLKEMVKKIDLRSAIIAGIDQMDIKDFEIMLIKIMKKELRAITYFGALLGAIIGVVTIFL